MDASHTRRLIKKLLDSRELMPDTREDLADHLSDLEKGALHADDASYVEALARRLGIAAGGTPAAANDSETEDDEPAEDFALDAEDDDDPAGMTDTAAAVQMEIALRAIEQARDIAARLRAPAAEGVGADSAALDELDTALGEAADALAPRG
jgi:hypothetical protein